MFFLYLKAILYLSHSNDKIAVHVIAYLYMLVYNGNKFAQDKIFVYLKEESTLLIRLCKLLTISASALTKDVE